MKKAIIIGSVLVVFSLILIFVTTRREEFTTVPETGGTQQVNLIDNEQKFYNASTYKDYQAVIFRLTEFLAQQNAEPSSDVRVVSVNEPDQESNVVELVVDIPAINRNGIKVTYDFSTQPNGKFTIDEYTTDLYPPLD